ncbi:Phage protein D [Lachnospiraceae bacterium]|nr:Phage protein D [Lachnospiraceae bacterium]
MGGFDKSGSYDITSLEKKYDSFMSPAAEIQVGSAKIDGMKIPITYLRVQQTVRNRSGSAEFQVSGMYDYEKGKWLENLLDSIDVGAKVTIKMGYMKSKKQVFFGYVDSYEVTYGSGHQPNITVSALDGMGLLMSGGERQDFGKKTTNEVVTELTKECKSAGLISSVTIDTLPKFQSQIRKETNCSNYDFLSQLAEMCFVNFCVINGEMLFSNLMKNTSSLVELTMGQCLLEFTRSVSMTRNSVGSVVVISNGTKDKKEVRGKAETPGKFGGSGDTAAKKVKGLSKTSRVIRMNFLQSEKECKDMAQNVLDYMNLGFSGGGGRCLGLPDLIPGRFIKIKGVDKKSNGSYFVSDVTQTLSEDGYYTEFEVCGLRG